MKKKSALQSAFFNPRALIGLFLVLTGVFLALLGFSVAQAQQNRFTPAKPTDPLVPALFDCSTIHELGIDKQENFRSGAIMIACGQEEGSRADSPVGIFVQAVKKLFAPLYGATDKDLVTGTETAPHIVQSETFTTGNPDNPNQILSAYNDSRGRNFNPINISGASFSNDGGSTFTRLTAANGQSPFPNTFGDPVILYNRPTGTWFTVWLDAACGSQGLGGFKSTTPGDPSPASWIHYCVHSNSNDDRESGWADNNPSSPFYGRMYVSWNDFNVGGGALFVRYSTDNGATWTNQRQITTGFVRDVQITGDLATGAVYIAGMDEGGGGFPHNDKNLIYRSTDGGNSWTNTYTGPIFPGPGVTAVGYFACMFPDAGGFWRHEGWGQPAALNGVVSLVYAQHGTGGDPGDVYYIRSTNMGMTFGAPLKLNTDATTRPQWQPNLSVDSNGTLFATWYDARESVSCTKGNPSVPCYRMWSRKSTDNGATWLPDDTFSDVVSPLPGQSDGGIQPTYAGDYDYGSAVLNRHLKAWVDGRVPIAGASQQDAFFDKDGGAPVPSSAVSRKVHGAAGTFDIPLPLVAIGGAVGIEDRTGPVSGEFQEVITFPNPVTVGGVAVTSGTGSATFSVAGSVVTVNLTGVTNAQRLGVTLMNVSDGTNTGDVMIPMGVLSGDTNASGAVNASDVSQTKDQSGNGTVGGNFREDVNSNGAINAADVSLVKSRTGTVLPP